MEIRTGDQWLPACPYETLETGRGVAVLLAGRQVALFRDRGGAVYAVGNRDPFSGAHVISRGLLGSRDGAPVVISPMYKQAFDLRSGACLDEPGAALPVWPVRLTPRARACAQDVARASAGAHSRETAPS
ncbi:MULTISPECIES: nitrite reductase small subunit NirD [Streptomyces]|uniref:nitrite reductase small subunit NirD n=1 Tax=Streptomyces sp. NPDC029704 TaxID=3156920 RepID=UPI0031E0B4B3